MQNNKTHSGVTFQGWPHLTVGGVGRNLASGLQLLGHRPTFVTALARDELANFALNQLSQIGLRPGENLHISWWEGNYEDLAANSGTLAPSEPVTPEASSCFALVLIDSISGQCQYVIANLEAIKAVTSETIATCCNSKLLTTPTTTTTTTTETTKTNVPLLVMDANLMNQTMERSIELCREHRVPIFIEPTDLSVLPRLVDCLKRIQGSDIKLFGDRNKSLSDKRETPDSGFEPLLCLSPNAIELEGMVSLFEGRQSFQGNVTEKGQLDKTNTKSSELLSLDQIKLMANVLMKNHLTSLKCLLVTLDKRGVLVAVRSRADCIENVQLMDEIRTDPVDLNSPILIKHFPPKQLIDKPVSASGAGDSFAAGFISGLLNNLCLQNCLNIGFDAALLALQDKNTVPSSLRQLARIK